MKRFTLHTAFLIVLIVRFQHLPLLPLYGISRFGFRITAPLCPRAGFCEAEPYSGTGFRLYSGISRFPVPPSRIPLTEAESKSGRFRSQAGLQRAELRSGTAVFFSGTHYSLFVNAAYAQNFPTSGLNSDADFKSEKQLNKND